MFGSSYKMNTAKLATISEVGHDQQDVDDREPLRGKAV
jgi:hypothetical protein